MIKDRKDYRKEGDEKINEFDVVKETVNIVDLIERYGSKMTNEKADTKGSKGYFATPCLLCGAGEKTPHFAVYPGTNSWATWCDGTQKGGSVIDLVMQVEGLDNYKALEKLKDIYSIEPAKQNIKPKMQKSIKREARKDYSKVISSGIKHINETDYFLKRGLSEEIIKEYKLGYFPKGIGAGKKYKYIIPVDNNFLIVRNSAESNSKDDRYQHWGDVKLTNIRYLENPSLTERFIFIVEGMMDALSLETIGYKAISVNSVSNAEKIMKAVRANKNNLKDKVLIIAGDSDSAGKKMNQALVKALTLQNIPIDIYIISQHHDFNDWLMRDRGNLEETLENYINSIKDKDFTSIEPKEIIEDEEDILSFNFSDVGNAERLVYLYGKLIRFSFSRNKWYIWNGKNWALDKSGTIDRMAKKVLRKVQKESEKLNDNDKFEKALKKQIRSFVIKSENDSRIKAMINQTKSQWGIAVKEEKLDADIYALNCQNGILNLKTGSLTPHNKEALITKIIPVEYVEGAECPNWLAFLDKIFMGDAELIEYIQRTVGYSLTGDISQQCFYMLYGSGANGKSTFLKTMKYILGDYADSLKGSSLMIRKNDEGARGDLAKLKGSRFVWASELNDGQTFDESLVKSLTGGDPVAVRFLYGEEFDLIPQFKLWIGTNEKPKIKGSNFGIWRRVRLIPFEYTIPDKEKNDLFFEESILPEISGILNWAIEGCIKWQKDSIIIPEKVKAASEEYKNEMDILQSFIDDCCITGKDKKADTKALYNAYIEWCNTTGEKVLTQTMFGKKMNDKGFKKGRTSYMRYYEGIGILSNRPKNELTEVKDNSFLFKEGIKQEKFKIK